MAVRTLDHCSAHCLRIFLLITAVWIAAAQDYTLNEVGRWPESPDGVGSAEDITFEVDRAYVAYSASGLQILDASAPATPRLLGSYKNAVFSVYSVSVFAGRALLAYGPGGYGVFDVFKPTYQNPSQPQYISGGAAKSGIYSAFLDYNYAYLPDSSYGLRIVDFSNPFVPELSYDTPGNAMDVRFDYDASLGNLICVADGASGLQILRNSSLGLELVGSYDTPGSASGVCVAGDIVYVADWTNGVVILNVANPSSPTPIATIGTPGSVFSVTAAKNLLFVTDYNAGFRVFDVSDPAQPRRVAAFTSASARKAVPFGNYVFLANGADGVRIFELLPPVSLKARQRNGIWELYWPSSYSGYSLQRASQVEPSDWQNFTYQATQVGSDWTAALEPLTAFYRLVK